MDHTNGGSPAFATMGRLLRVQLIDWTVARTWPWLLVATSFAINLCVVSAIDDTARADFWTGGLATIYVGTFIVCLFTMTQWLPFALCHSVTRARFYASSVLVALGQCLAFAVVLTALLATERATGGWGVTLRFFGPEHVSVDNIAAQLGLYTVSLSAAAFWGMVWGLVSRRWGPWGVLAGLLLTMVVLFGVIAVLTRPGVWTAVVDWHAGRSQLALILIWSLAPAAVAAGIGFGLIRRATPHSPT